MSNDMLALCKRYDKMRQFFYEDNLYFSLGSADGPIGGAWLNCLRAFYSYAAMRDASLVVYQSTLFQIPFKKTEKAETVDYLSKGAIQALLAQPDAGSKKGTRDLFLMPLMYDTAARVQEVMDLKICDIRLGDTPQVKLHGKGNRSRSIPLMKDNVSRYHRYMRVFHPGERHDVADIFI